MNHWKQRQPLAYDTDIVVICFQISIFEPLETTEGEKKRRKKSL
ncbi:hypothetical protein BOVAB4_4359 [Bacteroides ovatus]|nr:hypothetical protein BOVAB4_4359 [Bacteroides ovatus]